MPDASIFDCDVFDLADRTFDAYPETVRFEDFGAYRILEPIGKGGMGEVFLAEDLSAARRVAVKFLRNVWADAELSERFGREIRTLAGLEHPFIARLYDHGILPDGTPWFAMEYAGGKPVDEFCRERRSSLEERMRLFRAICEAVQYAHERAVVHLDLKPANILVQEDGTPKVLDFGIAKHLENPTTPASQTQLRFTPAFAAPEQILRQPLGTYTDVYALGMVLYQLLAGILPNDLEGCTPATAEAIIVNGREPEKPSLAAKRVSASKTAWADLNVLCLKALKRDVRRRYQSVLELAQDVDHFLNHEPLKARPDRLIYRTTKFVQRNGRAVLASAAAVALIAGLISFYTVRVVEARDVALTQTARTERIQRFMLSMFAGDDDSGPPDDLRVVTILARAVQQAELLKKEPVVQTALYQTLGSIYQKLGKLDRADSLLQSALNTAKSSFGSQSPEVADSLVALGLLRIDEAKFAEAERSVREGLQIDRRNLPSDHPALARDLTALGSVLEHRGAYADAVKVLEQAVRLQSKPSTDAAGLAESLTYLSNSQHLLGENILADAPARQVLALDRQVYGERHPRVAEDLSNLAQISEDLGRYGEAEKNNRSALDIAHAWYGRDHIETALLSEALGKTLVREHKYGEAIGLLKPALLVLERQLGKNHPFVALGFNWLGVAALKRGNLGEAETDFRSVDEIYRIVYGEDDARLAMVASRFGELSLARKQYSQAETSFREAVQRFSKAFSADNAKTGGAQIELGGVLLRELRYQEAETQFLAGYRTVTRKNSFSPDSAMDAREGLIAVYDALKMPAKAARFQAEVVNSQLAIASN